MTAPAPSPDAHAEATHAADLADPAFNEVIVVDGDCVLCSRLVQFVIARDADRRFRFTAVQSDVGRALAAALEIDPDNPATTALITQGRALTRSDAAIAIAAALPGWGWTRTLRIVPRPIRDAAYALVASNRYRWFGRSPNCLAPQPADRDRFIS